MIPADHVTTAAMSAVGDCEGNVIDPERRGCYVDAFGFIQVRPPRATYRVGNSLGWYASPTGMVVL